MLDLQETDAARGDLGSADAMTRAVLERALAGHPLSNAEALHLIALPNGALAPLLAVAAHVRTRSKGRRVTYSPKAFLPITNLCRDYCSYCTFRKDPDDPEAWTMSPNEVRTTSYDARALGCIEALMCLGDKPERVFPAYRALLSSYGHDTTISYVAECCEIALGQGLLPHTNAGLMTREELQLLKLTNVSMGLMLESSSRRLMERGGPHRNAPDKEPRLRLDMMREAGEQQIPFTTGILLGIGETQAERVESLRAIADLHATYGHIQEIIVQNFRAKPSTRMATHPEPESWDTARTLAVARLMLPEMNLQAPPNLSPFDHRLFLAAGINDWGGISPLTKDYVNPEAPWPHIETLAATCRDEGFELVPRLPVYEEYLERDGFVDPRLRASIAVVGERLLPSLRTTPQRITRSNDQPCGTTYAK